MKWRPFEYQGATYNLSHLDPFYWRYTAEAGGKRPECTYKFQVSFSMHCFTRKALSSETIGDGLWYTGPKESRVFCVDRYAFSTQLPDIVRSMGERPCWHTHHGNFFTIELTTQEERVVEYEIYFDVTKASRKGWLNLILESAYERTDAYATTQPRNLENEKSVWMLSLTIDR
ncbi:MAG: hypothetical protein COB33_014725 [Thiotrichaceae bacterium]|nr:hypothetical protein [Thiotrichaceae bacterium]PCI12929.1 MAG: hypothetical protein COB71_07385 [Thiotrichales bacterium]